MATLPRTVLIATAVGLTSNAYFSSGSLALSYLAIPAILIPADAPLMPPLELVKAKQDRKYDISRAPRQPADSGEGNKSESILEMGATSKINQSSPSTTGHLLRQWFHLFSKGMHIYPPFALSAALSYLYCAYILPGRGLDYDTKYVITQRGLYALSTIFSMGIMAFTVTALRPTNQALHRRTEEVVQKEEKGTRFEAGMNEKVETETLIRNWAKLNAVRAILPILASISATLALII